MDGGARPQLEARVRRLETAVSALLSEYATARDRLHDLEGATDAGAVEDGESEAETAPAAVQAAAQVTVASDREATQAEVERAVRQAEAGEESPEPGTTRRESDIVEPNVR